MPMVKTKQPRQISTVDKQYKHFFLFLSFELSHLLTFIFLLIDLITYLHAHWFIFIMSIL